MFNPENYDYDKIEKNDFEIIIQSNNDSKLIKIDKVFWWTD